MLKTLNSILEIDLRVAALLSGFNNSEKFIKAIEKIVDSTAAGDSFNSEILVGLLRKIPINDAINNGVNLAKKVIVGKGALVPSNV